MKDKAETEMYTVKELRDLADGTYCDFKNPHRWNNAHWNKEKCGECHSCLRAKALRWCADLLRIHVR